MVAGVRNEVQQRDSAPEFGVIELKFGAEGSALVPVGAIRV